MDGSDSFRSTEHIAAIDAMAGTMVELGGASLPAPLADRVRSILFDLLGVTLAGSRTSEMISLRESWAVEAGSTHPIGSNVGTTVETASELDAIAACCLELDEGNKYAAGHPAAHVLPAAIAATRLSPTPISGPTFLTAVVAGYEVAARFGWALTRNSSWHTHGHWGATGAATAAALIGGAAADEVAAAIDSSSALVQVAPWAVVLDGNFSRNLWMAGAARAGVNAARLSRAGLVHNSGAVAHTLGSMVGTLNVARLTEDLGDRWLTLEGYTKRHASCSYTHAAVDAVQSLRSDAGWSADDVERVWVRTHSLAEPLFRRHPSSRLGAMFSLPFVVAAAFVSDAIDVESLDPRGATFAAAELLSARIDVASSSELDALLPDRRAAEVTIELRNGSTVSVTTPNPVGDIDHFPMDDAALRAKISRLVGEPDTTVLEDVVDALGTTEDVAGLLSTLPRH